jgi:hypothetical protein
MPTTTVGNSVETVGELGQCLCGLFSAVPLYAALGAVIGAGLCATSAPLGVIAGVVCIGAAVVSCAIKD